MIAGGIVCLVLGIALLIVAALIPVPSPNSFPGPDPRVPWMLFGFLALGAGVTLLAGYYRFFVLEHWLGNDVRRDKHS